MCNLYERIKEACAAQGLTVSAMCLQLGMSKSVMSDLHSGRKKSLSAETLRRIADHLGVSTDSLLGNAPRDILEDVDVAFYGQYKELDEAQKEMVRDMVRLMRQKRNE